MKARRSRAISIGATLLLLAVAASAAEVKETDLPPPATAKIDFARDVQPIFAESCLRCHGPERPKSNFRLTDRASALKGGANGVDIIPGESAKSPLIHYVARLVSDMEMPPEGKGTPLSTNQVAVLRAWIDQGVYWGDASSATQSAANIAVSPIASWTGVHGDQSKFRELEWQPEGWNGGVEKFEFNQLFPDGRSVSGEGHLLRDDYKLKLELRKPDLGFTRFGFEQFRKYYDDAGGYFAAFNPPLYRLDQDLHLDVGRAWAEVGLTLPNWPRIVAGYEYQYKNGSKSMLTWGPVSSPSDTRNIFPSFKDIDESAHIIRLDVSYDLHGFEFEDNLRAEIYSLDTRRFDALFTAAGSAAPPPDSILQVREGTQYTQIANAAKLQKEIADWWLAGVGYRYSWLDGDASFALSPTNTASGTPVGNITANSILLNEVWQVGNAYSQFRMGPHLTGTFGFQGQWKRQETFGDATIDEVVDPSDPTSDVIRTPVTEQSTLDQTSAEESLVFRYTGLPYTSLFGEARLKQEDYTRTADQTGTPHEFGLVEDAKVRWTDYLVGFNTSPWPKVSFGGHYRHRDRTTDYTYPDVTRQPESAYPGFILGRDIATDEVEVRVSVRPALWLKTSLTYRWSDTDFHTTTAYFTNEFEQTSMPGGTVFAGRSDAHTVSANATMTPFRRLSLATTVSYQYSRTTTFDNGSPSVVPYQGDTWWVIGSATYAINEATDIFASTSFASARFAQNNAAAGLPLGIDYNRYGAQAGVVRRFSKNLTGRLQYAYYAYQEPSSANLLNYTANQILAMLDVRW